MPCVTSEHMCGIVGLFAKSPEIEARLGVHLAAMLVQMNDRGPDSAGVAVYRDPAPSGSSKLTLYSADPHEDWRAFAEARGRVRRVPEPSVRASHAVVVVEADAAEAEAGCASTAGAARDERGQGDRDLQGGRAARAVRRRRSGSPTSRGTHALGHTRMATESRVTTEGSHPFSTGLDLCLVHNGSLSNHNRLRANLRREGIEFQTENDTEVAAGYLAWRLREGASLEQALEGCLDDSTASTPSSSGRPTASRCCAIRSRASRPCSRRPTTGLRWRRSGARSPCSPARRTRARGSPSRASSTRGRRRACDGRRRGEHAAAEVVDLAVTPLRELNQRLHDLARRRRARAAGASSTRTARTRSPAGWTPTSRSRSRVTSATTAPG